MDLKHFSKIKNTMENDYLWVNFIYSMQKLLGGCNYIIIRVNFIKLCYE